MPPEFVVGAVVKLTGVNHSSVMGRIIALWHNGFTVRTGGHGSQVFTTQYSEFWDVLDGVSTH